VDLTKYCEQHKYVFDNCFNQDDDNYKVCLFLKFNILINIYNLCFNLIIIISNIFFT
jgi:hypothetical protein